MKFAHLADCHIGSWRDPKLRDISTDAFVKAIDTCIEKQVDFILIAGDLFNTSLPSIDRLKMTVEKLKELKDKDVPVYMIAGSHDFSPSGKTMLDVLESAGLIVNVTKGDIVNEKIKLNFTVDRKTGAKITGMLGKKGSLEKSYYENLITEHLEKEEGYKIFMFHSAITELKPKSLEKTESHPLSLLPKNFNYYAGGHPHYVFNKEEKDYGLITYPGPLFPNNFKELEELGNGGFYIVEDNKAEWHPIQIYNTFSIKINCENKTPEQVKEDVLKEIKNKEFNDTIVTIRLEGTLVSGKPSDIDLKNVFELIYGKSAYFVMKNTNALTTKEFEEIKVQAGSVKEVEESLIKEHLGQIKVENMTTEKEEQLIKNLMNSLTTEKKEGERVVDFEKRVKEEIGMLLLNV
jgi:DNA repair exonuclease SbcCD nuclease subunit|tara:strand:- start:2858 stop:4072 length:1215 start_codon:yes stop_codon:yes gene_type:complete